MMEVSAINSHSNGLPNLKHTTAANNGKKPNEKAYRSSHTNGNPNLKHTSSFVNHAAIAWQEERRKWVGDKSQRPSRMVKEPTISWSTSYEELLLTNEPFAEPVPLAEMVDFLVDIWYDEGLFD